MNKRRAIRAASALVATACLGATAVVLGPTTASAGPGIYFEKKNLACLAVVETESHFDSVDNPSGSNRFWQYAECGRPTSVTAGNIKNRP